MKTFFQFADSQVSRYTARFDKLTTDYVNNLLISTFSDNQNNSMTSNKTTLYLYFQEVYYLRGGNDPSLVDMTISSRDLPTNKIHLRFELYKQAVKLAIESMKITVVALSRYVAKDKIHIYAPTLFITYSEQEVWDAFYNDFASSKATLHMPSE